MEITQSEMVEVQKSIHNSAKVSARQSVGHSMLMNKAPVVSKVVQKGNVGKKGRLARSKSRGRVTNEQ